MYLATKRSSASDLLSTMRISLDMGGSRSFRWAVDIFRFFGGGGSGALISAAVVAWSARRLRTISSTRDTRSFGFWGASSNSVLSAWLSCLRVRIGKLWCRRESVFRVTSCKGESRKDSDGELPCPSWSLPSSLESEIKSETRPLVLRLVRVVATNPIGGDERGGVSSRSNMKSII